MEKYENTQTRETTADIIVHELTDEKNGPTFVREYLKAGFLSSAVDALFYARRQAGLTQAQVAERLNTKQAAIARLEADTDGSLSLRRYVEFALACGMVPLDITLAPIDSVRDFVITHPESPLTQELYNAWIKKRAEPAPVSQHIPGRTLTIQAVIDAAQPTHTAMSNQGPHQEEKLVVKSAEQILKEQYLRQVGQALPQWSGEGVTNTSSVSRTLTLAQTTDSSAWSAVLNNR